MRENNVTENYSSGRGGGGIETKKDETDKKKDGGVGFAFGI